MQRLLFILFFLFICFASMAQTDSNSQYIFLPPVFETISEKVMVKPSKFGWKGVHFSETQSPIRPFHCGELEDCLVWDFIEIPAQYEMVTHNILKENSKKLIYHPPVFEMVSEKVMVKPAMGKWIKALPSKEELAKMICCYPLENCKVWTFIETSAEYETTTHQILKSPAYFEDPSIPNEEETEAFEENQIAEKTSFKKSVEVQNSHSSLQFYPNSASELVTIEVQAPIEELFVTDFAGKTLLHFKQLNEILSFSVNTFPSGIYFLRYLDGNFWRSERLVVVR